MLFRSRFSDNFADYVGGAIWSIARGRFSGAAGLRFDGNSVGGAQSVAFSAASCETRESQQLISSWERAGRYAEGADGEVTCANDLAPLSSRGTAHRYVHPSTSLGSVELSAQDLATLLQIRNAIEGLLHR